VAPIQALGAVLLGLKLPELRPWSAEQLSVSLTEHFPGADRHLTFTLPNEHADFAIPAC
jgi:hypothetical protein